MAFALRHEEELNLGEGMRLRSTGARVLHRLGWLLIGAAAIGGLMAVLAGFYLHGHGFLSDAVVVAETDATLPFVRHPQRCVQLLGGHDSGDTLPAAFSVDLDAALNASRFPVAQAIAQLGSRCRQRQGTSVALTNS